MKDFKLKKRQEEIEKAEAVLTQKKQLIASASETLDSFDDKISESETQFAEVKEKISSTTEDLEKKQKKVQDILNFLPDIDRNDKLEKDYFNIKTEIAGYMKSGFSMMRNKDDIVKLINKLYNIVKKAIDMVQKYSNTIFDLRENFTRCKNDNDEFRKKNNDMYNRNRKLSKENQTLAESNEFMSDVLSLVEHTQPELVNRAKTVVQDNKAQQEQTLIYQQQKKKYSHELE